MTKNSNTIQILESVISQYVSQLHPNGGDLTQTHLKNICVSSKKNAVLPPLFFASMNRMLLSSLSMMKAHRHILKLIQYSS